MNHSAEETGDWHGQHVETGFYPPVTYLLIDDLYIAHMQGLRRVLNRPQRADQPVLQCDQPWEVGTHMWFINGVLYDPDEKLFKLYYLAHDPGFCKTHPELKWEHRYAYAISADCRNWQKPELGLVDWKGSKRNNLVALPYPTGGDGPLSSVFKNTGDPDPNRRFVAFGMERYLKQPGERAITGPGSPPESEIPLACGLYIYDSPDGLTWTRRPQKQMSQAIVMDGTSAHGFDEDLQAWILWPRARYQPIPSQKYRTIGVSITRDLERIPYPQMAMAPDEHDPPGVDFDRLTTIKVPGGYVGMLRVGRYIVDPVKGKQAYPIECQLAFSRDARSWSRPASRESYLSCGPSGSFDDHSLCPANPIQVGDDIYILSSSNTVVPGGSRIGLFTLKRDRWAAIAPIGGLPGTLQTRPTYLANQTLGVNADASGGSITAELVDVLTNQPLPGYSLADCDPFTGDSLDHTMTWNGQARIPAELIGEAYNEGLPGRVVTIRFYFEHARLFSFAC